MRVQELSASDLYRVSSSLGQACEERIERLRKLRRVRKVAR
jgi:hypothetical protein